MLLNSKLVELIALRSQYLAHIFLSYNDYPLVLVINLLIPAATQNYFCSRPFSDLFLTLASSCLETTIAVTFCLECYIYRSILSNHNKFIDYILN